MSKSLSELKRELKRLKEQNKRLKKQNIKLKKQNKILLKKEKRIKKINKELKKENKQLKFNKVLRSSIHYYNRTYEKSFRVEVYHKDIKNENVIKNQLLDFLEYSINKIPNTPMRIGLLKLYKNSYIDGFEVNEPVGSNDVGSSQLNRMRFFID